jgi:probable pyridine nucleotide-disulfide oxidoreductase
MDQAKAGRKVALVEAGMIGGACINVACIPTKTLVRSAQVAEVVRHGAAFGAVASGPLIDMAAVAGRTSGVVAEMVDFNLRGFQQSGLELVLGWSRFVEPRVIEVETDAAVGASRAPGSISISAPALPSRRFPAWPTRLHSPMSKRSSSLSCQSGC